MTTNLTGLEQQLAEARAAEAERIRRETDAAKERERNYRRDWLASYDREDTRREVAEARDAVVAAFEATPAFAALAEYHAAMWRQHRAASIAHSHRVALARDEGKTPPHDPGTRQPPALVADAIVSAISNMVSRRVGEWEEGQNEAFAAAVYGENLTHEEILAAEAEAEERRRAEAARSLTAASIDVAGMTDEERAKLGLPAGSSRTGYPETGGFRPVLG